MRLTADSAEANTIRSFRPGEIRLRDSVITSNVIVAADRIIEPWHPSPIAQLTLDDLQPVLQLNPEIILLGTGEQQVFPPIGLLTSLMQSGIAIEVMHTHAACRTFNVLLAEHRGVIAALLVR